MDDIALETAKHRARQAAEHVTRQKEIVADLEQSGKSTTLAKDLLGLFETDHVQRQAVLDGLTARAL